MLELEILIDELNMDVQETSNAETLQSIDRCISINMHRDDTRHRAMFTSRINGLHVESSITESEAES